MRQRCGSSDAFFFQEKSRRPRTCPLRASFLRRRDPLRISLSFRYFAPLRQTSDKASPSFLQNLKKKFFFEILVFVFLYRIGLKPGPGRYGSGRALDPVKGNGWTSSFVSKTKRGGPFPDKKSWFEPI